MNMKFGSRLIVGSLFAAFSFASTAHAITYNVYRTIGDGTVSGFIETDGTIGVLASSNITDWAFSLTAPNLLGGSPDAISYPGPSLVFSGVVGAATVASTTELTFDFSSSGSYFLFKGVGPDFNFWCLETDGCTGSVARESLGFSTVLGFEFVASHTGIVVFANVAIPLPSALPLFGTALAGMGFIGWRRRRKAAA